MNLVVELGPEQGRQIPVNKSPVVIGRGQACDITLHDKRASTQHARLAYANGAWTVYDLGSTNGTWVNRKPIKGSYTLHSNDKLGIGKTVLGFKNWGAPPEQHRQAANRKDPNIARQRHPRENANVVFCTKCGQENTLNASVCTRCTTPITTLPLKSVKRLIGLAQKGANEETRIAALQALGRLKVRRAIPILLETANIKGFKRSKEQWAAKFALTQIVDLSESMIICSKCGHDNPATAKFCGQCGTPTTRPTATKQEFAHFMRQIQERSAPFPLRAVQTLGQLQSRVAVPALLDRFKKLRKGLKDNVELLIVLEALVDIGDPAAVKEISKTARRWRHASLPITSNCIQALHRLGAHQDVDSFFVMLCWPPTENDGKGHNLRYILQYGEILQDTSEISYLTQKIRNERKIWKTRIGFGYLIFDPVTLIISAVFASASILMQKYIITRDSERGKEQAATMVFPWMLDPLEFKKLPSQVRLMIAMHCYSTALTKIARRDHATIQTEFKKRRKPIERAVIGLALAQTGDASVLETLAKLSKNRDWPVRILAYEGLMALNNVTRDISLSLQALQDRDLQVRVAVAQAMANSENPAYIPYILQLADAKDRKQRRAIVSVIAQLAQSGIPQAQKKLQRMAKDRDKRVRELVSAYVDT